MHPSEVLFQGKRQPLLLPACDHYCGSEKLMRKSMALQQELGPVFDITFDCEDGAAAGGKAPTPTGGIAVNSDDNRYNRIGVRLHDVDSPHFVQDVATIVGAAAAALRLRGAAEAERPRRRRCAPGNVNRVAAPAGRAACRCTC